ncbi:hypothetical protein BX600DRAFT_445056 [Xylariales sp. PMI_506]|nr:hypothetical protein BX600DRAFT_445056 [Xylariales sp. PMI_506]
MPTIDEVDEMEDFINWDCAGADAGLELQEILQGVPTQQSEQINMDLVLNDVDGDDWSFWALQHYESTQAPQDVTMSAMEDPLTAPVAEPLSQIYWETPVSPCGHCARGGYQCKLIREGRYKGYCTSCVALRCECSFGPVGNHAGSEIGETFPANPWPTMGDRPATSILHEDDLAAVSSSAAIPLEDGNNASSKAPPKIGARFSRESVRILKNWVSTHSRHPYPTEEEKESLQKVTGLNKTQITNWLANARRRGKIQPTRSTSPHVGRGYIQAIDIPQRKGTPRSFETLNPLQRWEISPPENEPASVTAIARAVNASSTVSSSSGRNSPYISGYSDDGSSRSLCNQSSISSFSNSHGSSGGSFASSHQSRGSFGSIPSFVRSNRGRRRRRRAPPKRVEDQLQQPLKTFQCTFCTETFRTKHDWQRHEKSLHLSLERWVCTPNGPKDLNPETGVISCVFCGEANPDEAHIESHNFSGCTERKLEERTFYRKDHLRQHLKLVHNVKFTSWSMDKWRVNSPEIRSRCGFCGIVMDSWSIRVDHLAEHFKTGNTMADWKGDWGFDEPVLEMVENSIPPYLIHDERNSPLPYMASENSPSTPNNAYDLLKYELQHWAHTCLEDTGRAPTDDEMRHEACRIIFGAEVLSQNPAHSSSSWLRDIMLANDEVTKRAMFQPVRKQSENRIASLRINGKDNIFDRCELETQLQEFVTGKELLGLTAMDQELQHEACKIIGRMEERSVNPSEDIANWLIRLINASPKWLRDFRKRARLPRSEDIAAGNERSKDLTLIDSTVHNYSRLDRELGEFLHVQRSIGLEPSDLDLQRQARLIIYDNDDDWNQTAADDAEWLTSFKQRYPLNSVATSTTDVSPTVPHTGPFQFSPIVSQQGNTLGTAVNSATNIVPPARPLRPGPFFLNDANCFHRLAKGLKRFVASTMSANNPNCHVPTDKELQHQARWIVYDDDDPWNQTAADNVEWLQRFKREAGILPPESGPGLPLDAISWAESGGGTGFAPPYIAPNPNASIEPLTENPKVFCREYTKPFEPDAATANHFLASLKQRYPAPAKVFCSRELENGLTEYVKRELGRTGIMPMDEELRLRARQILGLSKTAADDSILLDKFKANVTAEVAGSVASGAPMSLTPNSMPTVTSGSTPDFMTAGEVPMDMSVLPLGADMILSDEEVNNILQDMDSDFQTEGLMNFAGSNPTGHFTMEL